MDLHAMRRVYLISAAFQGEYEVGFANGLSRNGVPVTVVGSNGSLTGRLDRGIVFLNLRGDQNPRRSAFEKAVNILRYAGALARTALNDRAAIFHTNGIFTLRRGLGVLFEALWCRVFFREWWLTVHNLLPHEEETWVNRIAFGIAYRLADRLFVHTMLTANALSRDFGIDPGRVRIFEHGIDRFIESDAGSKARIRRQFDLPEFRTLILLFGNISPYKGVDLLMEAVERAALPADAFVLIAGRSASADYKGELNSRLASMRRAGQIAWRDQFIADENIPDLLAAADCMVLPYRKIDQSGVIFAAKSAGLPIIASDVGAFNAYIQPGRDFLVPPADVDALADALSQMARRGPLTEREAHIDSARRKYGWEVTLRSYADFVKNC
jgi:glycosyltransferase involved in cell wall biosynthesis